MATIFLSVFVYTLFPMEVIDFEPILLMVFGYLLALAWNTVALVSLFE